MTVATQFLPFAVVATTSAVQNGACKIAKIYWYQPTASSNTVVLQDQNGSVIWQGFCESANASQVFEFPKPIEVQGWQVPTLASGTLFIYTA
jgi:hypothetical protein